MGDYTDNGFYITTAPWGASITKVIIEDGVTTIVDYAFFGCIELTDVWYEGSSSDRTKISIGSGNSDFTGATWHYNSCMKSTASNKAHSYNNTCDPTCNTCGATRTAGALVYDNDVDDIPGVTTDDAIYVLFAINFPESYPLH